MLLFNNIEMYVFTIVFIYKYNVIFVTLLYTILSVGSMKLRTKMWFEFYIIL